MILLAYDLEMRFFRSVLFDLLFKISNNIPQNVSFI